MTSSIIDRFAAGAGKVSPYFIFLQFGVTIIFTDYSFYIINQSEENKMKKTFKKRILALAAALVMT